MWPGVINIASGGRLPARHEAAGAITGLDVMAQRPTHLVGAMLVRTPSSGLGRVAIVAVWEVVGGDAGQEVVRVDGRLTRDRVASIGVSRAGVDMCVSDRSPLIVDDAVAPGAPAVVVGQVAGDLGGDGTEARYFPGPFGSAQGGQGHDQPDRCDAVGRCGIR
jgi:hypothetical protein